MYIAKGKFIIFNAIVIEPSKIGSIMLEFKFYFYISVPKLLHCLSEAEKYGLNSAQIPLA